MLIMIVTSNWEQIYKLFYNSKEISFFRFYRKV